MLKIIAGYNQELFALHNTKTNEVKIFKQDPRELLYFFGESLSNFSIFADKYSFEQSVKFYIKNVVNKENQKRAFHFIKDVIQKHGYPLLGGGQFNLVLSDTQYLELIFWKNKVVTILEYDRKRSGIVIRLDLDEKNELGFYTDDKEVWLFDLEKFLKESF